MKNEIIHKKLIKSIDRVPALKAILLSSDSIDEKRHKIRYFLSDILMATFDDNPTTPPLEWILARNAVNMFRCILSYRSERLTGFSLLQYINDLLHKENIEAMEKPTQGLTIKNA